MVQITNMNAVLVTISCALFYVFAEGQELRLQETKPGVCYKIHNSNQPRFYPNPRKPIYSDLFQSCTEWIKHDKNDCLSLKTQNDEVLILSCVGVRSRRRPGCYKIINKDKREEIVCQKTDRKEGCDIITTRTNLNIVVGCLPKGTLTKKQKGTRDLRAFTRIG